MKTIITTVGTSLFENYMKEEVKNAYEIENNCSLKDISEKYKELRDKRTSGEEFDLNESAEKEICKTIKNKWLKGFTKKDKKWVVKNGINEFASAEIQSIVKIKNEIGNEDISVKLIMTDTSLSRLAGKLIKDWLQEKNIACELYPYIKDLRIDNANTFVKTGLINLYDNLDKILEYGRESSSFYLLNITGGYKSLIPFISIFGQLNDIKTFYLFEDTDEIIWLPLLPISIDYGLFQENYQLFSTLKGGIIDHWETFKSKNNIRPKIENQIQVIRENGSEDLIGLNAVGEYLFNRFNNSILVKINKFASIFSEKEGNKKELKGAIYELYKKLNSEIKHNSLQNEEEINEYIKGLGDKNDLRHGSNPKPNVFIFKSTNIGQIRLVYGIEFQSNNLSLVLYDYKRGQFNHHTYINEFKKKMSLIKSFEFVPITLKKQ